MLTSLLNCHLGKWRHMASCKIYHHKLKNICSKVSTIYYYINTDFFKFTPTAHVFHPHIVHHFTAKHEEFVSRTFSLALNTIQIIMLSTETNRPRWHLQMPRCQYTGCGHVLHTQERWGSHKHKQSTQGVAGGSAQSCCIHKKGGGRTIQITQYRDQ